MPDDFEDADDFEDEDVDDDYEFDEEDLEPDEDGDEEDEFVDDELGEVEAIGPEPFEWKPILIFVSLLVVGLLIYAWLHDAQAIANLPVR